MIYNMGPLVRIIGVAKLTLIQPIVPSANKVVTQGNVHEQIDLLRCSNVQDHTDEAGEGGKPKRLSFSSSSRCGTLRQSAEFSSSMGTD